MVRGARTLTFDMSYLLWLFITNKGENFNTSQVRYFSLSNVLYQPTHLSNTRNGHVQTS